MNSDFGTDAATIQRILDTFYQNDIMVIMTVASTSSDIKTGDYLTAVQEFRAWLRQILGKPPIT